MLMRVHAVQHAQVEIGERGARIMTPAALTTTSTPPKASSAASKSAATAASSLTSARTASARPPLAATSSTADSALGVVARVVDHDGVAVGGEPSRRPGAADPARASGDDGDASCCGAHDEVLLRKYVYPMYIYTNMNTVSI